MFKKLYNKLFKTTSSEKLKKLEGEARSKLFKDGYTVISENHSCAQYSESHKCLHVITEKISLNYFMVRCLECEFHDHFNVWEMDYVPSIKSIDFDVLDEI